MEYMDSSYPQKIFVQFLHWWIYTLKVTLHSNRAFNIRSVKHFAPYISTSKRRLFCLHVPYGNHLKHGWWDHTTQFSHIVLTGTGAGSLDDSSDVEDSLNSLS